MNFELKTLSLVAASKTSADTLIVLVDDKFQPGKDPVSKLIEAALAAKDLTHKAGKTLAAYRVAGISAPRICLVAVGDGHVAQIKTGLSAALPTLKSTGIARLAICWAGPTAAACVQAAVLAVSEGTYVYGGTQSKPALRKLNQVTLGLPSLTAGHQSSFATAVAMVQGIELAKEWACTEPNGGSVDILDLHLAAADLLRQRGLHEGIEIAIKHIAWCPRRDPGAQVLDQLIGLQNV